MRRALLVVLLCAAPARGLWFTSRATLNAPRKDFEAGRYLAVVADLQDRVGRLRSSEQAEGYLLLGQAQERLGRLDQALGVMQLAVRLHPKDINLLTELAVLLHRSGLEEQAEPLFQKVLRIHPNNAVAHLGLAEIDHALGFLDRSAEHYERALETMSDDAAVWRDYAEVLISARDFKTAELAARKSLSLREDAEGLVDLARAQRADGRLNDALAQLDLAVSRFPRRADLAMTRALWLLEARREDDAAKAVEPLLAAPQPAPLAYWIRARVRLKRDQYRAAVDDLRRAAAAGRGSPFVAAAAKELLKQLGAE
jgi:tetratricopeptide (TPR) repeat protein